MSSPNYLVQVNIYIVIYFAFYKIFLSRETFFSFNRWFLLGALLTTLLLPFLKIGGLTSTAVHYPAQQLMAVLNEVTVRPRQAPGTLGSSWSLFNALTFIYFAGVIISVLILLKSLLYIYRMIRKNPMYRDRSYRHIILPDDKEAFSFWCFLFTGRQADQQIILHEMAHIRQKHSLDILLLEIIKAFCWFNPFIYLYKKNLTAVHEYIADGIATRHGSKYEYAALLVGQSFGVPSNILIQTFFNTSLLKSRIVMLQKTKSRKIAAWKYSLSLPVIAALIFISSTTFALKNKVNTAIENLKEVTTENIIPSAQSMIRGDKNNLGITIEKQKTYGTDNITNLPAGTTITVKGRVTDENGNSVTNATIQVTYQVNDNKGQNSGVYPAGTTGRLQKAKDFVSIGTTSNEDGYYTLPGVPANGILNVRRIGYAARSIAVENKSIINIMLHQSTEKLNQVVVVGFASPQSNVASYPKPDTGGPKLFTWVEQMPRYPGTPSEEASQDSIMNFIRHHINYPSEARKDHIQGTVYVQFIVKNDGTISSVKAVNSFHIGGGLEQEAIRVVRSMPKWIPGRQNGKPVTVQFSIPVKFVLQ